METALEMDRESPGGGVKGIAYPSSRHPGGVAVVLFFDQEQCSDSVAEQNDVWLVLDPSSLGRVVLP